MACARWQPSAAGYANGSSERSESEVSSDMTKLEGPSRTLQHIKERVSSRRPGLASQYELIGQSWEGRYHTPVPTLTLQSNSPS